MFLQVAAVPLQLALFAAGMVSMKRRPQPGPHRWVGAALAFGAMLWVLAAPVGSAVGHVLIVAGGGYAISLAVRRMRSEALQASRIVKHEADSAR